MKLFRKLSLKSFFKLKTKREYLHQMIQNDTFKMKVGLVIFLFNLCSVHLYAFPDESSEDTLATIYLNNAVIISAQRYETNVFDQSESVASIEKKQLEHLSLMTMPEALSFVPGVWMQKTNHGGGSAFVRGLTGYQTLLMIDGIRMNNSTYRSGPNQYLNTIDPLMVERIEVVRGGGSVQYGSDAIGGTIQTFSLNPVFSDEGIVAGGSLYGKYWSSDMEHTGRAQFHIGSKKFTFIGGGTYKNLGDIKAGGDLGTLDPTGYDAYSMDFKLKYRPNTNQELTAAYQRVKQMDVPLYHKVAPGDYQLNQFNPQVRDLAYVRLRSFYARKFISEIRYTASYQNSLEVREKQKTGSDEFVTEEDRVNTFGATVEVISEISKAWKASSGIEYYHDLVNSKAHTDNLETGAQADYRGLYPDGSTYGNFAIYTLHNYQLNKWEFSAGLRYNLVRLHVEDTTFGNTTITPDALVGNVGIVYKFNPRHHLVMNINSAFRAPNINDVSSFGIADFRYEVPAYNLKPETTLNTELGYKFKYPRISGTAYVFHNKLNDLIANVPAQYQGMDSLDGYKVYQRENINEAKIYGAEAELEVMLTQKLVGYGNIAYFHGQNISKDEPMRRIPPLNGRLGVRANFDNHFWCRADWIVSGAQKRLSSGDISDDRIAEGGTPAWNILNIYGGYDHPYFSISGSLHNIFNTEYRVHGSGIDGMGRSFWVSLKIHINR